MICKGFLLSFMLTLILGLPWIWILRRLKMGQMVRSDGPQTHWGKKGTPTMGGLIFLSAISLALLLDPTPLNVFALLLTWGYALIGLADDALKVVFRRPLGLYARQKLGGQLFLGLVAGLLAVSYLHRGSEIITPVLKCSWNLGWFYPLFAALVLTATANALNLTDGLDGLAAGVTFWVAGAYILISRAAGQEDLALFAALVAGGCLGFLVYNFHPARVFMGDTGSLALGAAVAFMAIMTKTELALILLGGVYVLEALSVILQVASFRLTGKRIFKMSPLHHHFELGGWPETGVVLFFWLLAFICVGAGLYILSL